MAAHGRWDRSPSERDRQLAASASYCLYMFSQMVIAGRPILRPTNVDPWILLSCLTFLASILVVVRPRRRPPTAQDRTSHADIAMLESARAGAGTGPPRK